MDNTLAPIIERFTTELQGWLADPSESSGKIESLRAQIIGLKGTLNGDALRTMEKALKDAEDGVKVQRQMAAGAANAQGVRGLGIRLEAGPPMKRKASKSSA